jgi:DNA (cytosine-5)-methyltransferase 1
VPIYEDVAALDKERLHKDGVGEIEVITGGFPCQDISCAGKGEGIKEGTRSGLWAHIRRLASDIRPRYLIVENVAALTYRGLGRVLGDLAEIGFDAEWELIPASYAGAPHRRERIWIIAYPNGERREGASLRHQTVRQLERVAAEAFRLPEPPEPPVLGVDARLPGGVDRDRLRGLGNTVVPQIPQALGMAIKRFNAFAQGL